MIGNYMQLTFVRVILILMCMTQTDCTGALDATDHDLRIATLVHAAAATVKPRVINGGAAGRFGDRKVFIADLWDAMVRLDASEGGFRTQGCDIGDLKAWLLYAMRLMDAAGAPLVLLSRADLVAAMDPASVARS